MRKCGMRRFSEYGNHSVLGYCTFSKWAKFQDSNRKRQDLGHLLLNNILFGFSNPKDTSALLATFSALLGNLETSARDSDVFFSRKNGGFSGRKWEVSGANMWFFTNKWVFTTENVDLSEECPKYCSRLSRTWLRTPMTYELPESTPWKHVPTVVNECFLATQTYFNGSL